MLLVAECVAQGRAGARRRAAAATPATTIPAMDPEWRKVNLVCSLARPTAPASRCDQQPMPPMRLDLLELFDRDELTKYLTDAELHRLDRASERRGEQ